jgi:beta-phosphoglucomutase-like phosphatase (HAD superfamily)
MTFSHIVIEYELEREELIGEFEAIVTSADYSVRKPHPFIFLGALGCLGVEAQTAWT